MQKGAVAQPPEMTEPMLKERLYLFDTTLRDGAQTTGVDFSLEDKRRIATILDELGLDYVEGGPFNRRREELSTILDGTNPDLSAFQKRGGKMIVTIGTNDTLASPGAQLDYYQSVLDRMGRATVDRFARFFVMPQTGHGLSGTNYNVDGEGRTIEAQPIPNRYDQLGLLFDWVENNKAPGMSVTVTAGDSFRSFVLGFLDHAEVLGPPDLRDDLVTWLEKIAGGAGGPS